MKKIIAMLLAVLFVCGALAACGGSSDKKTDDKKSDGGETKADSDFKVGVVLVGDENEGYTFAHMEGIKEAAKELGLSDDQIIWKYNIPEDEQCKDACDDLVGQGCSVIFTNSYGHQSYTQQAAEEYPDVQFVAMTGDTAKASGLENFSNAFTRVYESRYVSGVVAGLKVKELLDADKIPAEGFDADGNVKIGYVGAYPYAEVVSGYTAFYLGIKSVVSNVVMDVQYTNSWFDMVAEDSTGAPSAVEAALKDGKVAYSVGYNVDMLSVAPTAALTSATNNWAVYYKYAIGTAKDGGKIETNWAEGYDADRWNAALDENKIPKAQ